MRDERCGKVLPWKKTFKLPCLSQGEKRNLFPYVIKGM